MKRLIIYIGLLIINISIFGCSKSERLDYLDENQPAPAQVSGVVVNATPGGAIINYRLPDDRNLSYVKAVYEIQPGVFRERRSSRYHDTLSLEGFGSVADQQVKLYSVGRNEKLSDPVLVTVKPLTPPVLSVFETADMTATFGGVKVTFDNISRANLAVVVIADTSGKNTWAPITTFFTSIEKGNYAARGMSNVERKVGLFIKDRWGNVSDTLIKTMTPLPEQFIPKNNFKLVKLPTDTWQNTFNYTIDKIWNGVTNNPEDVFIVSATYPVPQWFTIDLGLSATFSRMKVYQRARYPYIAPMIKTFEIYGSNNPDAGGGWGTWQLLGTFTSVKPSGLPFGQTNTEDVDYAVINGEDFDFDGTMAPVRYIRFKTLDTWAAGGGVQTSEISFWGQVH
ncbi:MAG: DUF4959 domain-containing protein [Pedobacter sp.]|nr:MAG: DUF4959 domain-containing protein [Pedobacter sp.]